MSKMRKFQCPQCSNIGVVGDNLASATETNTNSVFFVCKCGKCQQALHIMSDKNNTMTWLASEIKIYTELFKKQTIVSGGNANILYVHLPDGYDNTTSYIKLEHFLTVERMKSKYIVIVPEKIANKIKWKDYADTLFVLPESVFFFGSFRSVPSAMAEEIVLEMSKIFSVNNFFSTFFTFFDCFHQIPVEKIGCSDILTNNKIYIGVNYDNKQGI